MISSNCCYIDEHEALNKMIDQLVNRNTGKANTRPKELLGTTEHLDELYCEAPDNASPQMMSRHSNLLEGSSSVSRQEKRYALHAANCCSRKRNRNQLIMLDPHINNYGIILFLHITSMSVLQIFRSLHLNALT